MYRDPSMRDVRLLGNTFSVADEPADFWGWVDEGRYNAEWIILQTFVKPEHTFVDLGAWVGSHSLCASTIAKRVLSVEPDPVAFPILEQNVRGRNITARQIAVGQPGTVTLGSGFLGASTTRANPNAGSGIGAWEPGQQFDIESVSLRELTADLPDPLFLKLDVEGSEEQILTDFDWFQERRPTMYLELHPFWWADEGATWELVKRVSQLYRQNLNLHLRPVDLNTCRTRELILSA
jgi:FkbM family methyltransferase